MGKRISALIQENPKLKLVGEATRQNPLSNCISGCDVIIDFSAVPSTLQALPIATEHHIPMMIGTTGFNAAQMEMIRQAAQKIPMVYSSNTSLGVNVLWKLIEVASKVLKDDWKIAITETHHVDKKDAPSGTAKTMADVVEQNQKMRPAIESLREGEVIGDHKIIFSSPLEILGIQHQAKNRDIFALGAIRAAEWLANKKPGLYTMAQVLEL